MTRKSSAGALRKCWTVKGYVTETFQNGGQFLDRMETAPFQIVFLDLTLPDTNGMEILSRLKSQA